MTRRINYRKAAIREGRKAALDAAGVAFPKLGTALGITSAVSHGANAIEYGLKAAKQASRRQIRGVKRTLKSRVPRISPRFPRLS